MNARARASQPSRRAPDDTAACAARDPFADLEALDQLTTLVVVTDLQGECLYVNTATEAALGRGRRHLVGGQVADWLVDPQPLRHTLQRLAQGELARRRFDAELRRAPASTAASAGEAHWPVQVVAGRLERERSCVLLEMVETSQQARHEREERLRTQAQAHKELVRNLAHEIGNPLGGIRGAAQLLQMQGIGGEGLEAAQVIVREADRLRALVDRLLAPHRAAPVMGDVNLHEVCEHVRLLLRAEFAHGLAIERDYDASLPEFRGDRERIVQTVLNIGRNAAQALSARIERGDARIVLRTRAAHQVTIGGQRWRLALLLQVQDNGPGVPEALRERIFDPLVSGRDGGSGLGLTLAQAFAQQHGGMIECRSVPGCTTFELLLPLP